MREETDAAQARLLLGFLGDVGNSTRETALLLLNQLLGGDRIRFCFGSCGRKMGFATKSNRTDIRFRRIFLCRQGFGQRMPSAFVRSCFPA